MNFQTPFPIPATHTKRFEDIQYTDLVDSEYVVISKDSTESRGQLSLWSSFPEQEKSRIIGIQQKDKETIYIEKAGSISEVPLRDNDALSSYLSEEKILIDISGMPHHVWAPLLKAVYHLKVQTRILYAEPKSYKPHPTPASETLFDLTESFDGLAPLPGFVQLSGPADESKCLFVSLLGFEGNRPERLAIQLDPTPKVIPIVGVPGFQIEYPTYTIACNRHLLQTYQAYSNIRYARASCPFEVMNLLDDIRRDYPDHYMYLAPIGTKPHSLGAILYAIANPDTTEIMFDHPNKKTGRTTGVGIIHIYDFGGFDEFRS